LEAVKKESTSRISTQYLMRMYIIHSYIDALITMVDANC
jgi:hypothetical protein